MAGIYIHIPFCRQKCYYCDFYKTVNTGQTPRFIKAIQQEARKRKDYVGSEKIKTIYFGGGTPSVLNANELAEILQFFRKEFEIEKEAEVTFEANPDDLTVKYLETLYKAGVNRLSIGLQALQNEHLERMNRRHDVQQAIASVTDAQKAGFQNLSVDLIYGLPELTIKEWKSTLEQVFSLPFQHLSAYHLTYHQGTPFYTWLKKGTLKELDEKESVEQFEILIETAERYGFEHYEISNFAKDQLYSKHNTSYWTGKKYLGLGPSAHSFNGKSRRWNMAHLEGYLKAQENNLPFFEEEVLSENEKFNEYILTRMRTKWGVSEQEIKNIFGLQVLNSFQNEIENYLRLELIKKENGNFTFTRKGLFISDDILSNMMII
ncbi:radical SAM family heme chaperone HemW [Maribellus maritimus]|uniref:radical SAM family heme chaperone HemW n=1 Tax=Maribellus maritimus TaxID=2870838 RepID=UPI001EEB0BEA|nr:radical SAM family heme chaperone HemW [Maribellus maritimus]MCG6190735.1 radical SAM family heme chaperone HemW [Maribellus maritimus]